MLAAHSFLPLASGAAINAHFGPLVSGDAKFLPVASGAVINDAFVDVLGGALPVSSGAKILSDYMFAASGAVINAHFAPLASGDAKFLPIGSGAAINAHFAPLASGVDIDGLSALGGVGVHQTQDHFIFSDNGTEKKITFSNLQDAIFADISGDGAVAAGGALTIADDKIGSAELVDACSAVTSFTAPLIEGTTSIQTPLIEYTDGDNAITIADGGAVTFAQSVNQAANAVTDGGAVDINCGLSNYHEVLMNANASSIVFTNATAGQRIVVRVKQHSTHIDLDANDGWDTVTVNGSTGTLHWPGGTEPTLTEANNAIDMFGFIFTSTVTTVHGFVIGQDIKA
jgi:hypothetical protein